MGIVIAFAPFADRLLALISGDRFAAGAPALIVISFAVALASLTHVLRFTLVACGRPTLVLLGDSVACTCAFVAYFGLIPRFSLLGAAAGTVVAEATALIAMSVGLRRAGRSLPSLANPAKAVAAGALAALAMKYLAGFGTPWLLALAAGGALYLALLALDGGDTETAHCRNIGCGTKDRSGPWLDTDDSAGCLSRRERQDCSPVVRQCWPARRRRFPAKEPLGVPAADRHADRRGCQSHSVEHRG